MPTCFISYSFDSDELRGWVRRLAERLRSAGIGVRLDQWDLLPGSDLLRYMETSVRESDFVLLVCTPTFAAKANASSGGVGYEKVVISGELFYSKGAAGKFIPLLRSGEPAESFPSYLLSKRFEDFRDDSKFDERCRILIKHMRQSSGSGKSPVGERTQVATNENSCVVNLESGLRYCERCGAGTGESTKCPGFTQHQFRSS